MSDTSQGPGWWMASDMKWYPPESAPGYQAGATNAGQQIPNFSAMPNQNMAYVAVPIDALGRPYAGWWRRVGASLIDGLVLLVPGLLVSLLSSSRGVVVLPLILGFVYQWQMLAAKGQTLGNMALGTAVADATTGAKPTSGRAAARAGASVGFELLSSLTLGLLALVDALWPLWDQRNQTLHDKVASTVVVKVK